MTTKEMPDVIVASEHQRWWPEGADVMPETVRYIRADTPAPVEISGLGEALKATGILTYEEREIFAPVFKAAKAYAALPKPDALPELPVDGCYYLDLTNLGGCDGPWLARIRLAPGYGCYSGSGPTPRAACEAAIAKIGDTHG